MKNTIQQSLVDTQGTRMDVFALRGYGFKAKSFVHSLLREYGEVHEGSYYVHLNDLSLSDKKILLSHVCEDYEYEEALSCNAKLEAYFKEYGRSMQRLLLEEGEEAYRDVMEEAHIYNHIYD